jgi:site-specific recombinase XerD
MKTRGIFERPKRSGVWWISYVDGTGKRRREKVGRRSAALEMYLQRRREIEEGRYTPPRDAGRSLSFRDLARDAMEDKRLRLAPRSYKTDAGRLQYWLGKIGALEAEKITPEILGKVFGDLSKAGNCGSTLNRYRALISSIFRYGVENDRIRANPVARVKRFRESESRVRYLRDREEEKLRAVIRLKYPEHEPELDLAMYTGMRRGEQFGLKWKDVDLELGILTVRGKTGRREIVANDAAIAALRLLAKVAPTEDFDRPPVQAFVCPQTKSDEQKDWRRWLEKSLKEAGVLDFHWHDLRHTFASRLVMAGADLISVQKLMGHKSILMTMRYAHLAPGHLRGAAEKIGRTQ